MNREIKFRGKRLDNGEWVYGSLCCAVSGNGDIAEIRDASFIWHKVDPHTVGQYIGLKDRNGREIYEGSVLKMHYFFENYDPTTLGAFEDEDEIIGVVGIDELGTYTENEDRKYYWLQYLQELSEETEVIGNKWDNPELLDVSQ